jgi:hypothetical protein
MCSDTNYRTNMTKVELIHPANTMGDFKVGVNTGV